MRVLACCFALAARASMGMELAELESLELRANQVAKSLNAIKTKLEQHEALNAEITSEMAQQYEEELQQALRSQSKSKNKLALKHKQHVKMMEEEEEDED